MERKQLIWIHKQKKILPKGKWQHITFTMPDVLWDFFWTSRYLLNFIGKLAGECVQSIATIKYLNAISGIFIAIHTFGRDLKRNVHIHLSVFLKGLSKELMKQRKYNIVNLFREAYYSGELVIPEKIQNRLNHTFTFNGFINQQYLRNIGMSIALNQLIVLNKILSILPDMLKDLLLLNQDLYTTMGIILFLNILTIKLIFLDILNLQPKILLPNLFLIFTMLTLGLLDIMGSYLID